MHADDDVATLSPNVGQPSLPTLLLLLLLLETFSPSPQLTAEIPPPTRWVGSENWDVDGARHFLSCETSHPIHHHTLYWGTLWAKISEWGGACRLGQPGHRWVVSIVLLHFKPHLAKNPPFYFDSIKKSNLRRHLAEVVLSHNWYDSFPMCLKQTSVSFGSSLKQKMKTRNFFVASVIAMLVIGRWQIDGRLIVWDYAEKTTVRSPATSFQLLLKAFSGVLIIFALLICLFCLSFIC